MRISDWSSDVCSSDLPHQLRPHHQRGGRRPRDRRVAAGVARDAGSCGVIYLDYQATTPLAPEALAAMLPWLESQHANRSEERRVGKECVSTCSLRWAPAR